MSELLQRLEKLSPRRLALMVAELQGRLEKAAAISEPIAVIGIGCRLPGGVTGPDSFWRLLIEGRDAIREVPPDRWDIDAYYDPDPDAPGKMATRWGGFIEGLEGFDAAFFGISPREASGMDPQQRHLLEVCWEALEHAGQSPERLSGSSTAVYVGMSTADYHQMLLSRGIEAVDAYLATGSAHSIAAGRVAYCLGLHGPNLAVDTACSSSLVAIHLACQALRNRECNLALAGGVNALLSPATTVTLSKARMMAPDGRCKAFDEAADGFVRAEGCGVVALKRLSDALASGDPILCVIRGSAVNQDGRSSGITAPNGAAQERVIRHALAAAGARPDDVGYVETHGTGTSLGDPIEAHALAAVFRGSREKSGPLVIGSAKTNVGHLESAAGVVGFIKAALCVAHGEIPPQLHFRRLNPHIMLDGARIEVADRLRPWTGAARLAGVSSFGFSGTNAHIILGPAPEREAPVNAVERPQHLLALSARSESALRALVDRYRQDLAAHPGLAAADVCHTAGAGRSHFAFRTTVTGRNVEELLSGLASCQVSEGPGRAEVVFLFPGQGAAYRGMGRELHETQPVFRAALERCAALFEAQGIGGLLRGIIGDGEPNPRHAQAELFAIEHALAELWMSWGVRPAAVAGHSLGEYAAACVAGVLSLEDACALVALRGERMAALTGSGTMSAILADEATVRAAVERLGLGVEIAALNAPRNTVVSGDAGEIVALERDMTDSGFAVRRLDVTGAFHSRLVEPMLEEFERRAAAVTYSAPEIPFFSTVTGAEIGLEEIGTGRYWARQIRHTVRFAPAMSALLQAGQRVFLEVGPGTTLCGLGREVSGGASAVFHASIRRGRGDWTQLLDALAGLYRAGFRIDWEGFDRPYRRRKVALPTYPFEHRTFPLPAPCEVARATGTPSRTSRALGVRLPTAVPTFEVSLGGAEFAYLRQHKVQGRAVVAGSFFLEMALGAASELAGPTDVREVQWHAPLVFASEDAAPTVQLVVPDAARREFRILSRTDSEWRLHVTGRFADATAALESAGAHVSWNDGADLRDAGAEAFFETLAENGIELGPDFRAMRTLALGTDVARLEVETDLREADHVVHPVVLDAVLQGFGALLARDASAAASLLSHVGGLRVTRPLRGRVIVTVRTRRDGGAVVGDARVTDASGEVVMELRDIRVSRSPIAAGRGGMEHLRMAWLPRPRPNKGTGGLPKLPDPAELASPLDEIGARLSVETGFATYPEFSARLDRVCSVHVARALTELGIEFVPGRRISREAWIAAGIVERHARLVPRLFEILAEDGFLRVEGDGWVVQRAPELDAPELSGGPFDAEAVLAQRCGSRLADVLRGVADPLTLLFPAGAVGEADRLYTDSPSARVFNTLATRAVQEALNSAPDRADWRVLEIGAGTGGTTAYVLPAIAGRVREYVFTDVSPAFLSRAQERFGAHSCLRTELLNVEDSPSVEADGVGGDFDVVIAANVLHATADLREAVRHAAARVRPGGWLVLLEGTRPERWVDLTFGLTEGWWRFRDPDLRASGPLVGPDVWERVLRECGFERTLALRVGDSQQVLLVARAPERAADAGAWWIIPDTGGIAHKALAEFRRRGVRCEIRSGPVAADGAEPPFGLLDFRPLDLRGWPEAAGVQEAGRLACESLLEDVRELSRRPETSTRLWMVTRGAVAATDDEPGLSPAQAMTWGLAKSVALEAPGCWGGIIDLDPGDPDAACVGDLVDEVLHPDPDYEVAFRGGRRLVPRLVRDAAPPPGAPVIAASGAYVVTGGLGALGLKVARWLVERGARQLVLAGRTGLPDRNRWAGLDGDGREARRVRAVQEIEAMGAQVRVLTLDLGDASAVTEALGELEREGLRIRGIVHAAAHLASADVLAMSTSELRAMLAPKVAGSLALAEYAAARPLDFVVFFSSTTALLGARGLGHYAAANQFMDVLAEAGRRRGMPLLSVNWGIWDDMSAASDASRAETLRSGLVPIASAEALEAMGSLLGAGRSRGIVAAADWNVLGGWYEARRRRPILDELRQPVNAAAVGGESKRASGPAGGLAEELRNAPVSEHSRIVEFRVASEVGAVLGMAPDQVPMNAGLFDLGMDSLMSVELRSRLEKVAGRSLPATLTFDHPSAGALSRYLLEAMGPGTPADAPGESENGSVTAPTRSQPAPVAPDDDLSEEEMEDLLAARLDALSRS